MYLHVFYFDLMFSEFEDTNGSVAPPACLPPIASCSGSTENHDIEALTLDNTETTIEHQMSQDHEHAQPGDTSDLNYLQEQVGGMLKITPSDIEVSHLPTYLRYTQNYKRTMKMLKTNLT